MISNRELGDIVQIWPTCIGINGSYGSDNLSSLRVRLQCFTIHLSRDNYPSTGPEISLPLHITSACWLSWQWRNHSTVTKSMMRRPKPPIMPPAIGPAILCLDDVLGVGDEIGDNGVLDTLVAVLIDVDKEVSGVSVISVLPPPTG